MGGVSMSVSDAILKRESVNISKIIVIALDFIFIFFYVVLVKRKDISIKKYYGLVTIIQILFLIIQLIILLNIRFIASSQGSCSNLYLGTVFSICISCPVYI